MHLDGLAWTEACKQLRYCNMGCWTRDGVMLERPECMVERAACPCFSTSPGSFLPDSWNPTRGLPIVLTNRRGTAASLLTLRRSKSKGSAPSLAEKSDVLLQRKGHAMKDKIALFVIVILACQFSPSYLARTSADQIGIASVYSVGSGRRTASGQELNREALTAAHRTLPLGTKVTVTNKSNGHSVVVTINDRGPFVRGRIIDLSPAAARVLGFSGLTHVTVNGE